MPMVCLTHSLKEDKAKRESLGGLIAEQAGLAGYLFGKRGNGGWSNLGVFGYWKGSGTVGKSEP